MIQENKFIEHTMYNKNLYGSSIEAVRTVMGSGKICILDIEMEGVKSLKRSDLNPHYLSIQPPSMPALEERLRGRGTETEESVQNRLKSAQAEIEFAKTPGVFDLVIVNDNLDVAYGQLRDFIQKHY